MIRAEDWQAPPLRESVCLALQVARQTKSRGRMEAARRAPQCPSPQEAIRKGCQMVQVASERKAPAERDRVHRSPGMRGRRVRERRAESGGWSSDLCSGLRKWMAHGKPREEMLEPTCMLLRFG